MFNEDGKRMRRAEPAMPVAVLGLQAVPNAGDHAQVVEDERAARALVERHQQLLAAGQAGPAAATTLDELLKNIQAGHVKDLNLILKADVSGSLEPIRDQLTRLSNENVKVKVIHEGTGAVTETDVQLAQASGAIIIGFNTRVEPSAQRIADAAKIEIRQYDIIYKMVEDIELALQGMLEPTYREVVEGHAEVRAIFKVGRTGVIAGSAVLDGKISRNATIRVRRGREQLWEGKIESLRRGKDDVREVLTGFEFGIKADGWNGFEEGDIIEAVVQERVS
jgi:translation initiation factor IF-2